MFPSSAIVEQLQADTLRDLLAFLPELILVGAIVSLLLLRLFSSLNRLHLGYLALIASAAAFLVAGAQWQGIGTFDPHPEPGSRTPFVLFSGMLLYDTYALYMRLFLLAALTLTFWLTLLTGIPDCDDSADFSVLLLGSTLGMLMMVSAFHLLMVFIAVEMASVPSYALAGFLKGKRRGSEAALKYVIYGAAASGIMLYGISLLAGKFGTGFLPDVVGGYLLTLKFGSMDPVLIAGTVFLLIGLSFKLAAVPFHFWCPDVFEGAAAEVAAFLSVASKGAALALTARILLAIASDAQVMVLLSGSVGLIVAALAGLSATFGNLAALGQTNLKRLLAYSTIAHAGYMLMAVAVLTPAAMNAVLFYLVAYLLMNLGAFGTVAFLRNLTGSEELTSFNGLVQRAPVLVITLAVFLLSLLGLPPLIGFAGKFQIFAALYEAFLFYRENFAGMSYVFLGLLALAVLNTVISAVVYLKVLRVMILDAPPENAPPLRVTFGMTLYSGLLAGLVVVLGLAWDPLSRLSREGVSSLYPQRFKVVVVTSPKGNP